MCIAPLDVITGITRFVAFLSSSAIKTQKQKHAALALDKRTARLEIWGKRESSERWDKWNHEKWCIIRVRHTREPFDSWVDRIITERDVAGLDDVIDLAIPVGLCSAYLSLADFQLHLDSFKNWFILKSSFSFQFHFWFSIRILDLRCRPSIFIAVVNASKMSVSCHFCHHVHIEYSMSLDKSNSNYALFEWFNFTDSMRWI